jgi:hypothetical protein
LKRALALRRLADEAANDHRHREPGPDLVDHQWKDHTRKDFDNVGARMFQRRKRRRKAQVVVEKQPLHGYHPLGAGCRDQPAVRGDDAVNPNLARKEGDARSILTEPGDQIDVDEGQLSAGLHRPDQWSEMKCGGAHKKDGGNLGCQGPGQLFSAPDDGRDWHTPEGFEETCDRYIDAAGVGGRDDRPSGHRHLLLDRLNSNDAPIFLMHDSEPSLTAAPAGRRLHTGNPAWRPSPNVGSPS